MADITIAVQHVKNAVTTQVHDPANGKTLISIGPGARRYRHNATDNDVVHGELRISSTLVEASSVMRVRISATNLTTFVSRSNAFLDLFDDEGYQVQFVASGVVIHQWDQCGPAEIEPGDGGDWSKYGFINPTKMQEYSLVIPHSPVSAAGLRI